ncbi:unnamed protein product [Linum trigynum]|uniref:Uncharacterized protein n=1 Tax=Linum trigynum TaxID=586398 RepID=A0AAV2DAU5_9ROSI
MLKKGKIMALVDTQTNNNFLHVDKVQRLSISYEKSRGLLKSLNLKVTPTHGVARKVQINFGGWVGEAYFFKVAMDDYQVINIIDFMDKKKACLIPFKNLMFIFKGGKGARCHY